MIDSTTVSDALPAPADARTIQSQLDEMRAEIRELRNRLAFRTEESRLAIDAALTPSNQARVVAETERVFVAPVHIEQRDDEADGLPYALVLVQVTKAADPVAIARLHTDWHRQLVALELPSPHVYRLVVTFQ